MPSPSETAGASNGLPLVAICTGGKSQSTFRPVIRISIYIPVAEGGTSFGRFDPAPLHDTAKRAKDGSNCSSVQSV